MVQIITVAARDKSCTDELALAFALLQFPPPWPVPLPFPSLLLVWQPRVMELLEDMGLEPSMMRNNEGCIVLKPADLQAYAARWVLV